MVITFRKTFLSAKHHATYLVSALCLIQTTRTPLIQSASELPGAENTFALALIDIDGHSIKKWK